MSEFVPVVPKAVEHREGVPAYTKAEFAEKSAEGYTCPIERGAVPIAL